MNSVLECLLEKTSTDEENKIFPVNLWKEDVHVSSLLLNLRGNGCAVITLMWTPGILSIVKICITSLFKISK